MKRNRMMRIASFLLLAVLATTCAISGTFAKYTSGFEASSSARVAKWDVKLGGTAGDATLDKVFTFDLFDTVYDTVDAGEDGVADDETDVADDRIAPGTWGSVSLTLTNDSEVNATYTVAFTQTGVAVPLQFSTTKDGTYTDISAFNASGALAMGGGTANITLFWRWAYEGDNAADTALGLASGDVFVNLNVTVTQAD